MPEGFFGNGRGKVLTLPEMAAAIHLDMCKSRDVMMACGSGRFGSGKREKVLVGINAVRWYPTGEYDASSSAIMAWRSALEGTEFEGDLDGATWSGNICGEFCDSGLFERKPPDFEPSIGDLYVNEERNVAVVQAGGYVTCFFYDEFRDCGGGRLVPRFDDDWDCILHYVG